MIKLRCPLLEIAWQVARPGEKAYESSCLKENCAWWYEKFSTTRRDAGECAILRLAKNTGKIGAL